MGKWAKRRRQTDIRRDPRCLAGSSERRGLRDVRGGAGVLSGADDERRPGKDFRPAWNSLYPRDPRVASRGTDADAIIVRRDAAARLIRSRDPLRTVAQTAATALAGRIAGQA